MSGSENILIRTITSADPAERNRSLDAICRSMSRSELLAACDELESFRQSAQNLYDRVRACLFLYAAYRFFLQEEFPENSAGPIPPTGYEDLLARRFELAIGQFRGAATKPEPNATLISALAEAYHHLAFQYLLDQVRRSVRASRGNQWMFRVGNAEDHAVRFRRELLQRAHGTLLYPVLAEATPVRLDLSHSGWSDIFFLGMDFPEGARVINISVDLGVYGRDRGTRPPIETYVRVIPEPVLRLTSIDLGATKDVSELRDLFNFGNDYLSLLKAGVIASGLIPPSFEGTDQTIAGILANAVGAGMGVELVTRVNDIPKGSRLAVSTNLLASIITVLMRATGQTARLEGGLDEQERRLVASRAILGEWLGGSGGGWQDSGGIWPGIKVIQGVLAREGDPEFGISRGCLLPSHRVLGKDELHPEITERLSNSLVLIHGGMAQNVGPILEMVTEKYLLRAHAEWEARLAMRGIFDAILQNLKTGDVHALGENTSRNFHGPLKTIIPWVTNAFTERIIARAKEALGPDYWGFLMLGGMSGGGMGIFVHPDRSAQFRDQVLEFMRETKRALDDALPFAMDPVVYNFSVNPAGTQAKLIMGSEAVLPASYYALQVPHLVRRPPETISYLRRAELDHFTANVVQPDQSFAMLRTVVSNLFRVAEGATGAEKAKWDEEAAVVKRTHGFDRVQHEHMRADLISGRIGLSRNRLPISTQIADVSDSDYIDASRLAHGASESGARAIRDGSVAVLTLAGGVGTRWTTGAGVVKAVNPFIQIAGRHRSFLEIHLSKTAKTAATFDSTIPHVVSTSFLTHAPIEKHLGITANYGYTGPLYLSPGRSLGQRLVPMARDLMFLWEETPQETLDEQKQKVRESVRAALLEWARSKGEGTDYTDNVPVQRFNPPGHWYELPNMLLNGVLRQMLEQQPKLQTLMLHNVDALGVALTPAEAGAHLESGNVLTFEVVPRRINDRGGGLARVNGQVRMLEGLAQPREEDELKLRFYNSMTTWVQIDPLLAVFGISREDLADAEKVAEAVRRMAQRVPTYVTIKDVKRRWGHGQEDVYPVAQFEKLWSDMTAIPDIKCGYLAVERKRGQQLKDPAELDEWANDGSREYVAERCAF